MNSTCILLQCAVGHIIDEIVSLEGLISVLGIARRILPDFSLFFI